MLLGIMKLNLGKTASPLAALLMLAALLGACVQAAVAEENQLNIGIKTLNQYYGEEYGKDPTLSNSQFPEEGGACVAQHRYTHFSPLITLDGDGNVIPWLADSYEVTDNDITFHLRDGIKFADGTPLNASTVKFNLDRIITYGWKDKFGGDGIQGGKPIFEYYESSEVIDDNTLRVHFSKGWLDMPNEFANMHFLGYFISPADVVPAWDIKGTLKYEKRYNGLGPYYVDEDASIQKEKVVLKRRNSWYDELDFHKPMLDTMVFTVISDAQTRLMALEKGDIDYIYRYWNAPLDALPSLQEDSSFTIVSRPDTQMYVLRTAWWKEPFNGTDGISLRKAICYTLNRDVLAEGAFYNYATPATDSMILSPSLPGVPDCCKNGYGYDLEKAKQMLADDGWEDLNGDGILEKNGRSLKIDLLISSSYYAWQKDLAILLQSQLKEVGIDVVIQDMEYGAWKEAKNNGEFDLGFSWSYPRYVPAGQSLQFNFESTTQYGNLYEDLDGSLDEIAKNSELATSETEREGYICQACQILYDEAGAIPLVYRNEYAVMSSKVEGFEFGALEILDRLEECTIHG